jgi:hypothetical protein
MFHRSNRRQVYHLEAEAVVVLANLSATSSDSSKSSLARHSQKSVSISPN